MRGRAAKPLKVYPYRVSYRRNTAASDCRIEFVIAATASMDCDFIVHTSSTAPPGQAVFRRARMPMQPPLSPIAVGRMASRPTTSGRLSWEPATVPL
jgi:hypothetical protein